MTGSHPLGIFPNGGLQTEIFNHESSTWIQTHDYPFTQRDGLPDADKYVQELIFDFYKIYRPVFFLKKRDFGQHFTLY